MNMKLKTLIAMASIAATMVTTATAFAANEKDTAIHDAVRITQNTRANLFESVNSANTTFYTGTAITPDVELFDGTKRLVKGVDYDLSYENNVSVGTATITVTFKGNYTGTRIVTFNIVARELSNDDVVFSVIENQTFTGNPIEPKPTITVDSITLEEGVDYDLSYTAYKLGYIDGYDDGTFRPDSPITRAEAVKIINSALERTDLSIDENPFSDVSSSHWAYKQILEASVSHKINSDN